MDIIQHADLLFLSTVPVVPKVGFDVGFLDAVEELGDKDNAIPGGGFQTDFGFFNVPVDEPFRN
jgi:hypothetical protein